MNIESIGAQPQTILPSRADEAASQVDRSREQNRQPQVSAEESKAPPEELLSQIKALTREGLYSVRFEKDRKSEEFVVKVVDQDTDEVIRQIPPEELVNLSRHLRELRGSIVDTVG